MGPLRAVSLVALVLGAALLVPGTSGADTEQCVTRGPQICLTTTDTPDSVSVATAASQTFVEYRATVSNHDTRTVTHLALHDVLPAGTTLHSVSPASCSSAGGAVDCDLGSLAGGASVTVIVTVRGPAAEGTIENRVTVSYDESSSDNPGNDPKQDTLTAVESTGVTATPGLASSWVPALTATDVSTDPTGTNVATPSQSQVASLHIQTAGRGAVAQLKTNQPGPFTCPEKQVCRTAGWVEADALIDGLPGIFDPPLRFFLRWDASVVLPKQTERNFAVFYSPNADGSDLQIISRRCSDAPPPCLDSVNEEPDGDFTAVLVQNHNGRMQ